MNILDEIFENKKQEVAQQKRKYTLTQIKTDALSSPVPVSFSKGLSKAKRLGRLAIIAEVKKASPSKGIICEDFDVEKSATAYIHNRVEAISVLTDEKYFQGSLDYLEIIASIPNHPPLLRKDFIYDPYQIYEARKAGASAILLIAAYLEQSLMEELLHLAHSLGLEALVEVHNESELEKVIPLDPKIIGVNNRNLKDFSVSLETTLRLIPQMPQNTLVIAESGIHTSSDARCMADAGIDGLLVGEAWMKAKDLTGLIRSLRQ